MDSRRNTEEIKNYVHCPRCDKILIQATIIIDGVIKCEKCHRRYLINIRDDSIVISLLSKSKDEN